MLDGDAQYRGTQNDVESCKHGLRCFEGGTGSTHNPADGQLCTHCQNQSIGPISERAMKIIVPVSLCRGYETPPRTDHCILRNDEREQSQTNGYSQSKVIVEGVDFIEVLLVVHGNPWRNPASPNIKGYHLYLDSTAMIITDKIASLFQKFTDNMKESKQIGVPWNTEIPSTSSTQVSSSECRS